MRSWLRHTEVGNTVLEHLKGLPRLEVARPRRHHQFDDARLKYVARTDATSSTRAQFPPRSATPARALKGLTRLEVLNVTATRISDAGLAHLKGLHQLKELDLMDTKVGDAGLEHLKGLSRPQSAGPLVARRIERRRTGTPQGIDQTAAAGPRRNRGSTASGCNPSKGLTELRTTGLLSHQGHRRRDGTPQGLDQTPRVEPQ